jgi:hypothetical protein
MLQFIGTVNIPYKLENDYFWFKKMNVTSEQVQRDIYDGKFYPWEVSCETWRLFKLNYYFQQMMRIKWNKIFMYQQCNFQCSLCYCSNSETWRIFVDSLCSVSRKLFPKLQGARLSNITKLIFNTQKRDSDRSKSTTSGTWRHVVW